MKFLFSLKFKKKNSIWTCFLFFKFPLKFFLEKWIISPTKHTLNFVKKRIYWRYNDKFNMLLLIVDIYFGTIYLKATIMLSKINVISQIKGLMHNIIIENLQKRIMWAKWWWNGLVVIRRLDKKENDEVGLCWYKSPKEFFSSTPFIHSHVKTVNVFQTIDA